MNVAVTGGAGFIGSHLCEKLLEQPGTRVLCLDNYSSSSPKNVEHLAERPGFKALTGDVREQEQLARLFQSEKIELVYHLAAVVGVARTLEKPLDVLEVNIKGTSNVLEAARRAGCRRVVAVSSSEVYGNPTELPEREDGIINPSLPYAVSKLAGEKYAEAYYQQHSMETVSLRLFNVYGPRQNATPYGFVVGIFVDRALQGQPPEVYGDGSQTRDFTYIDDCVQALLLAGHRDAAAGQVFNVGTGESVTILDLAHLIVKLCGGQPAPVLVPERPFDIKHRRADISRIKTLLGYQPRYTLVQGLGPTIRWYQQRAVESEVR